MKYLSIVLLFVSSLVWGQTKISDGTLKVSVTGAEKIPVSGVGHPVINAALLHSYHKLRLDTGLVFNTARARSTQDVLWIKSTQSAYGDFFLTAAETDFGDAFGSPAQKDFVSMYGYNNTPFGARRNTNDATMFMSFESHFNGISADDFELIWGLVSRDGSLSKRLHYAITNKATLATTQFWATNQTDWRVNNDANPFFSIGSGTAASSVDGFRIQKGTSTNAADLIIAADALGGQVNITNQGTGSAPVLNFNSAGGYQFSGGGASFLYPITAIGNSNFQGNLYLSTKLELSGTPGSSLQYIDAENGIGNFDLNNGPFGAGGYAYRFRANGTTHMTLSDPIANTTGNLWVSGTVRANDMSALGPLASGSYGAVGSNYYYDGFNGVAKGVVSDRAWALEFGGGSMAFKTASATANTNISWSTVANLATDGSLTITGLTAGAGNNIVGVSTNNSATAGNIGEEFSSTISSYTNYTTTATYQAITSITLTAGDWDLAAFVTYSSNSATITAAANAIFVISTTTASASGATEGLNIIYVPQAALLGTSKFTDTVAPYRVSLSGTTTYYLNTQATFTIGNPQFVGTLRARRVR